MEYLDKVELLNKYIDAYYNKDTSLVTDEEFDVLYKELLKEEEETGVVATNSPSKRVGSIVNTKFTKVNHITPMWSLDNVFSIEELSKWCAGTGDNIFYCEPKYDGVSLDLVYEYGKLVKGITRGDGRIGEDVTENVKEIKSIPQTIPDKDLLEIRGEVVILKKDFIKLNEEKAKAGLPLLSNTRNAASGSLRLLDSKEIVNRKLTFIPYGIGENSLDNPTTSEDIKYLGTIGFMQPPITFFTKEVFKLSEIIKYFNNEKDKLEMDTDGVVIKIDSKEIQTKLGYTSKFPKHSIAFKFPAKEHTSKITDIILQVGRQGIITPVAIIKPINIGGVTVTRATLHNFDEIARLDIRIDDTIAIIRSGEVIPKILHAKKDARDKNSKPYTPPSICPSCGKPLTDYVCTNKECPAQVIGRISYFISKDCLDIKGFGEKLVKQLVDEKIIKEPKDVLFITKSDLSKLDGFQETKVNKIIDAISSIKGLPYWKFINSLDIPNVGRTASKIIAKLYGNEFINIAPSEYADINGFGDTLVKSLTDYLNTNKELVKELEKVLQPTVPPKIDTSGKYNNKTIVITGTFDKPRNTLISELESMGAKVTNKITKNTDFLLANTTIGNKVKQANKLNIPIIKGI